MLLPGESRWICADGTDRPTDGRTPDRYITLSARRGQSSKQEAQLSPRPPRDTLYQLKCCSTVVPITQIPVLAWGAFSATATLYSVTCIVLYTHRCSRLNYRTASMRCSVSHTRNAEVSRKCDQQTFTTTKVVDGTMYSLNSADHHSGGHKSFGGEASEPETSRSIEIRNF